jgi:hypothetical protein
VGVVGRLRLLFFRLHVSGGNLMSNNYSVSFSPALSGNLVGIYGQVNSTYIFIVTFKSALDQAFAANGQAGIESYLSPLMLAASQAFYQSAGDQNPTLRSGTPIPAGLSINRTLDYPNIPGSWVA